jgi:hypothetical protein
MERWGTDRRVEGWLMMDSPVPTLVLSAGYLLFIKLGTVYMKGACM